MDLSEANTRLAAVKTAYDAALKAHAAGHGDRTVTRQSIQDLRSELDYWQRIVDNLTAAAAGSSRLGVRIANWS